MTCAGVCVCVCHTHTHAYAHILYILCVYTHINLMTVRHAVPSLKADVSSSSSQLSAAVLHRQQCNDIAAAANHPANQPSQPAEQPASQPRRAAAVYRFKPNEIRVEILINDTLPRLTVRFTRGRVARLRVRGVVGVRFRRF